MVVLIVFLLFSIPLRPINITSFFRFASLLFFNIGIHMSLENYGLHIQTFDFLIKINKHRKCCRTRIIYYYYICKEFSFNLVF